LNLTENDMRRIMPPNIKSIYVDKPESAERLKLVYDRIFMIARQNIVNRAELQAGKQDRKTP